MRIDYDRAINVPNLDTFTIGGETFHGIAYQGLFNTNTKTYVEEPTRTNDGSMPDIDDHDTFIVPRVEITFKYFSIYDYQRFCRAILSSNQFPVTYWDKQFGTFVTHYMYMEPEELNTFYNQGTKVLGLLDYTVSLIGTLNNREQYTFWYRPMYRENGVLTALTAKTTAYSATTTYEQGSIVYWNSNYYKAIYYNNTFTGIAPPNMTYWRAITPTPWNMLATYNEGDVVTTLDTDGSTLYYEAIQSGFSGYSVTNTNYWKSLDIAAYSASATYTQGAYCLQGSVLYKAIYYNDLFSGQSPDNAEYWQRVERCVGDAPSTHILTSTDLSNFYNIPEGKTFVAWNTRDDGTGYTILPNANYTVCENTTLYPKIESAQWQTFK